MSNQNVPTSKEIIKNYEMSFRAWMDGKSNNSVNDDVDFLEDETLFRLTDMDFFWRMVWKIGMSFVGRRPAVNDTLLTSFGILQATINLRRGKSAEYRGSLTPWDDISYLRMRDSVLFMRKLGSPIDEKLGVLKPARVKDLIQNFEVFRDEGRIPSRFSLVNQKPGLLRPILIWILILGGWAAFSILKNGSAASPAVCSVVSATLKPDVFLDAQGNPDVGQTMEFVIKNVGAAGDIEINAYLSNSEGQWSREQTIRFEAGEQRALRYTFPEPTINATNQDGKYQCEPEPEKK